MARQCCYGGCIDCDSASALRQSMCHRSAAHQRWPGVKQLLGKACLVRKKQSKKGERKKEESRKKERRKKESMSG